MDANIFQMQQCCKDKKKTYQVGGLIKSLFIKYRLYNAASSLFFIFAWT